MQERKTHMKDDKSNWNSKKGDGKYGKNYNRHKNQNYKKNYKDKNINKNFVQH